MNKTMLKRFTTLLLALILGVGAMIPLVPSVSAATSSTVATNLSAKLPLVTYAMPLSGASRVYSYSNSSLRSRTSGYYIDSFTDQIVITQVSADGRAVYVTYPSSSAKGGYRSRWFAADDILGTATVNVKAYTAAATSTTYRMRSSAATVSYGSIARNDSCLSLGSHVIAGKTYYPTVYPISAGRYNGISGVRYKLALATTAPTVNTSTWQMPMTNAYCTWRSYQNWSWGTYNNNSGNRDYHLGIDIYGSNANVYAAASGTVVAASTSNAGANGRYIIIQHALNGQTVYSFYAHLSSVNVYVGQPVNKGVQIGVAGGSGYGRNYNYGTHLHFAIVDTLWTNGGYWGYATYFTGNKTTYGGVTFYNPIYVIQNNRLP